MKRFILLFACIAALTGMVNSKNQPAERHPFPTTVEAWPKHYPMARLSALPSCRNKSGRNLLPKTPTNFPTS